MVGVLWRAWPWLQYTGIRAEVFVPAAFDALVFILLHFVAGITHILRGILCGLLIPAFVNAHI